MTNEQLSFSMEWDADPKNNKKVKAKKSHQSKSASEAPKEIKAEIVREEQGEESLAVSRVMLTVSELVRQIKNQLSQEQFRQIWIVGELSNVSQSANGHIYLTIKDDKASISGVMFRTRAERLKFKPESGLKVEVFGDISVYDKRGQLQLNLQMMHPEGMGDLQLAYEQLRKKLEAKGYFDPAAKKPIPAFASQIGIITSLQAAALQDMLRTSRIHFPNVQLYIYPAMVQGEGAAQTIANAIKTANEHGKAEVLIVGRGGGSQEDLWSFNEETVASAIYDSELPIISAVGHEVDFTLADFTADYRAATPTAAAEYISKNLAMVEDQHSHFLKIAYRQIKRKMEFVQSRQSRLQPRQVLNSIRQNLSNKVQQHDEQQWRIRNDVLRIKEKAEQRFIQMAHKLDALNPFKVLKRGYSIVEKDGSIITRSEQIKEGDKLRLRFSKGEHTVRVEP